MELVWVVHEDDYDRIVVLAVYSDEKKMLDDFAGRGILLQEDGVGGYQFTRGRYSIYAIKFQINEFSI